MAPRVFPPPPPGGKLLGIMATDTSSASTQVSILIRFTTVNTVWKDEVKIAATKSEFANAGECRSSNACTICCSKM